MSVRKRTWSMNGERARGVDRRLCRPGRRTPHQDLRRAPRRGGLSRQCQCRDMRRPAHRRPPQPDDHRCRRALAQGWNRRRPGARHPGRLSRRRAPAHQPNAGRRSAVAVDGADGARLRGSSRRHPFAGDGAPGAGLARRHRGRRHGARPGGAERRARTSAPCTGGGAPRAKPQAGVDIPTPAEIRTLIPHLRGRWRPLILVAAFTGLRSSELRGLRWSDVDLKRGEIQVRQRADRYNVFGPPKSAAGSRTIPLLPMVVNALREHKLACKQSAADLVFPPRPAT